MRQAKYNKSRIIKSLATGLFIAGCSLQVANALDIVPTNTGYYYRLGGGSTIQMPPVTSQTSLQIGGPSVDMNVSCNGFNPMVSVSNQINNLKSSLQGMSQSVISSATAAVGSLPMYGLSKANKDLYDLLQNTMSIAQNQFNLSVKSCQQALNEISQGKSPYQDWFSVSDSQGWLNYAKQAADGQDIDVNDAKSQLAKEPAKYGVPWVHAGQNSAGSVGNQVPIQVVKDVVIAGYNMLVNRSRALDDQSPAPTDSALYQYWPTPADASAWAQLVLGDIKITSKEGEAMDTHGGIGLTTLMLTCPDNTGRLETCVKTLQENLIKIVQANRAPTGEDLAKVSSAQLMVTPQLIQAIRNQSPQEQALSISQIAENVAVQNTVSEALLMKQILIVGENVQVIHNMQPAVDNINHAIKRLDGEIYDIQDQINLKKDLLTNTAGVILNQQTTEQVKAQSNRQGTQKPLEINGSIYQNN